MQNRKGLTHDLEGGSVYEGNSISNPVTPKQRVILDYINEHTNLNLQPTNSNDAYTLIGLHYNSVRRMLMDKKRNN